MLQLNKDELQDGIGVIIQAANTDIIDDVQSLADAIKADGDNDMKEKLLIQCGKLQSIYNDSFKPSVDGLIEDFSSAYEIAELLEKSDVGSVSSSDASFKSKNIDPSTVRL